MASRTSPFFTVVPIFLSSIVARQHNWVPIERTEVNIKIRSNKSSSPVIRQTQFPLMLSWACTVHEVQGLSLDKIVVSFDLEKQRAFKCGQMYVVLCRITSLQGLFLTGQEAGAIKADKKALEEYQRLNSKSSLLSIPACSPMTGNSFTVALLNMH